MKKNSRKPPTEDWEVVRDLLPEGWEGMARRTGAVHRKRGLYDQQRLLRVLLVHLVGGCSLVETALRVQQAGWGRISAVALFKRLKAAEQWLRWMAQRLFQRHGALEPSAGRRMLAVDATNVQEMGPTGSLWRVHWLVNLEDLQCEHYELTDVRGGETFRRFPVKAGDIVLGDRAYGNPPGVAWVTKHGAEVVVRVNPRSLPLFSRPGQRFPLLRRLRHLRRGQVAHWQAWVRGPDKQWIAGRLVAIRLSPAAIRRAQRWLRRRSQRQQRRLSKRAMELAKYVLIWTTLPQREYPARRLLRLYRLRWQIELVFKRTKSILGLGQLPAHIDASARAWLHGKLLAALLLERLWEEAEASSPWGIFPRQRRSRWRETHFLLREMIGALVPRLGLSQTIRHWDEIRRRLAASPRRRPRVSLS